jgi:hypothetical protein
MTKSTNPLYFDTAAHTHTHTHIATNVQPVCLNTLFLQIMIYIWNNKSKLNSKEIFDVDTAHKIKFWMQICGRIVPTVRFIILFQVGQHTHGRDEQGSITKAHHYLSPSCRDYFLVASAVFHVQCGPELCRRAYAIFVKSCGELAPHVFHETAL